MVLEGSDPVDLALFQTCGILAYTSTRYRQPPFIYIRLASSVNDQKSLKRTLVLPHHIDNFSWWS